MSYKLKSTAKLVNKDGTGTSEFISALKPSTAPFQILPIQTGTPGNNVNVVIKVTDQGAFTIFPSGQLITTPTVTRGSTSIQYEQTGSIIVNNGDVIKFTYAMSATPTLNPKVYFSAL